MQMAMSLSLHRKYTNLPKLKGKKEETPQNNHGNCYIQRAGNCDRYCLLVNILNFQGSVLLYLPTKDVKSSGADPPIAMKVAPATSSDK